MKIVQQGRMHEIESHEKVGHDAAAVWEKAKIVISNYFWIMQNVLYRDKRKENPPCLELLKHSFRELYDWNEANFLHFFWLCNNLHHDFLQLMKVKVLLSFSSPTQLLFAYSIKFVHRDNFRGWKLKCQI